MVGPQRKQRKPTISKPGGMDFKSVSELKSDEEKSQRRNKVPHYTPKKKVILLPAPMEEEQNKTKKE